MDASEYERAIKDLDEMREAMVYWGNILKRMDKVKFIRNSRKIYREEEYKSRADEEEKFIESEKLKFTDDNEE